MGEHHVNIEEYADTVSSYIAKCPGDMIVIQSFTAQNNQKAWMPAELHMLLKAQDAAYRALFGGIKSGKKVIRRKKILRESL